MDINPQETNKMMERLLGEPTDFCQVCKKKVAYVSTHRGEEACTECLLEKFGLEAFI